MHFLTCFLSILKTAYKEEKELFFPVGMKHNLLSPHSTATQEKEVPQHQCVFLVQTDTQLYFYISSTCLDCGLGAGFSVMESVQVLSAPPKNQSQILSN